MHEQPKTAGSAESDLIESMLHRQKQVLTELDDLFDRIDTVIGELSEERKREAARAGDFLQFVPTPFGPQPAGPLEPRAEISGGQLGQQDKAA